MRFQLTVCLIVTTLAVAFSPQVCAADWPCWRGPGRNGISAETGWNDKWPAGGPAVKWKANVGLGYSTFVVAGDRVITTGFADNADTVFCFAADSGNVLWKHSYPSELGDKFFDGGTTGTPTIDGDRVYTLSRWGDVSCLDATTGKVIWSTHVQKDHGVRVPGWGFSGAPLIHKELVILNAGDAGMALEKATGKVVWKSANKEAGYSTPHLIDVAGGSLALVGSAQSYVAVDPLTGKEAWRIRWLTQYGVNSADPICDGARLFLSTGYGKGAALFAIGEAQPKQVWQSKVLRTQLNPGILSQGYVYGPDGDTTTTAPLKCVEMATGKEKWSYPGFGSGAVIIADGKLIALSGSGELIVAPVSPEGFKPTSRAQVLGGKCWTSPVLANGRIYCRNSRGDVVCLDVSK